MWHGKYPYRKLHIKIGAASCIKYIILLYRLTKRLLLFKAGFLHSYDANGTLHGIL